MRCEHYQKIIETVTKENLHDCETTLDKHLKKCKICNEAGETDLKFLKKEFMVSGFDPDAFYENRIKPNIYQKPKQKVSPVLRWCAAAMFFIVFALAIFRKPTSADNLIIDQFTQIELDRLYEDVSWVDDNTEWESEILFYLIEELDLEELDELVF